MFPNHHNVETIVTKFHTRSITLGVLINIFAILIFVMPGCSSADSDSNTEDDDKLAGSVEVDGSSTVYPVSEAVAEEFNKLYPNVRVNVGVSGSGGGFKRFVNGETDISDASRPIRENEAAEAEENGIDYIELRIGTDGLSVIVNNDNDKQVFDDASWLLLDQARIIEGQPVSDPNKFAKRMNTLLQKGIGL